MNPDPRRCFHCHRLSAEVVADTITLSDHTLGMQYSLHCSRGCGYLTRGFPTPEQLLTVYDRAATLPEHDEIDFGRRTNVLTAVVAVGALLSWIVFLVVQIGG